MTDSLAINLEGLTPNGQDRETIPLQTLQELRSKKLSYSQIGKIVGCSAQACWERLNKLEADIEESKHFKEGEKDILNVVRWKLIKTLDDEAIKNMAPRDRIMSYGILYDKYRLETGQSTENQAIIVKGLLGLQGASSE